MTALLTLQRQPSTPDGTFGVLYRNGSQIAVTAELPWADNEPGKSCIPAGTYTCVPHNSPAHPNTWEITMVPNRSAILIHSGNFPLKDSLGCVLVGNTYRADADGNINSVLNSVETLNQLRLTLPRYFTLTVIDAPTKGA